MARNVAEKCHMEVKEMQHQVQLAGETRQCLASNQINRLEKWPALVTASCIPHGSLFGMSKERKRSAGSLKTGNQTAVPIVVDQWVRGSRLKQKSSQSTQSCR